MQFSRQEYWSELPFPTPGELHKPGIKSASLMSPALAGKFFTTSATWEALSRVCFAIIPTGVDESIDETTLGYELVIVESK